VHTIVVLIVNAFSPAAGVRVEGDGYWRWCVLKRVVVLKPKIKRSGGLEVGLGQARFDSAVSLRRWSGVRVEWCDAVRCGYAPVRTNANAALRCARGREACRGQLGKLEFGRLKAASDARLPWEA
jgi:hypothetical protein